MWFEVNQHKERSIRTFNEKGSEVEIIICQVISITARLIVPFNTSPFYGKHLTNFIKWSCSIQVTDQESGGCVKH